MGADRGGIAAVRITREAHTLSRVLAAVLNVDFTEALLKIGEHRI